MSTPLSWVPVLLPSSRSAGQLLATGLVQSTPDPVTIVEPLTGVPPAVKIRPADLDNGAGTGTPDGGVDINDLLYFLVQFEAGSAEADLANNAGLGFPDGGVDINDLLFFLAHFEAGC